MPEERADLLPLDVDAVPVVAVGTAGWVLALGVVLATGGTADRAWTCMCGAALGLLGIVVSRRMQRR